VVEGVYSVPKNQASPPYSNPLSATSSSSQPK
jgi:hypothetical protein